MLTGLGDSVEEVSLVLLVSLQIFLGLLVISSLESFDFSNAGFQVSSLSDVEIGLTDFVLSSGLNLVNALDGVGFRSDLSLQIVNLVLQLVLSQSSLCNFGEVIGEVQDLNMISGSNGVVITLVEPLCESLSVFDHISVGERTGIELVKFPHEFVEVSQVQFNIDVVGRLGISQESNEVLEQVNERSWGLLLKFRVDPLEFFLLKLTKSFLSSLVGLVDTLEEGSLLDLEIRNLAISSLNSSVQLRNIAT